MFEKEATVRIKINKLLEAAGWRFFPDGGTPANIRLKSIATITSTDLDALGENFEKAERGFVDFLLLGARGFPLIVLEAEAEDKNPLGGKEQARKYARSQNCRFVILSNGNLHYFWDLVSMNPSGPSGHRPLSRLPSLMPPSLQAVQPLPFSSDWPGPMM